MSDNRFSDGSASSYAELPVKSAYLRWRRGNANMRAVAKTDPALFFGGWKANVKNRDGEMNPVLPIPAVERVSEDGKHTYEAYATNVLEFLPLQHRTRFELREKSKDPMTGRDVVTIRAVSKERMQGYTPVRQVFGLVFHGDQYAPAVIYIDSWSAFISFERAGQKWNKVNPPSGKALVRRYGSVGVKDKETGAVLPNFETYGESRSTPIEAVDVAHPRFVDVTDEMNQLYDASLEWKNCPRWNAEGKTDETIGEPTAKRKFLEAALAIRLTDVEIEQLLAENDGDYERALIALSPDNINAALAEADENPY